MKTYTMIKNHTVKINTVAPQTITFTANENYLSITRAARKAAGLQRHPCKIRTNESGITITPQGLNQNYRVICELPKETVEARESLAREQAAKCLQHRMAVRLSE